jgi:hypothetical protein
MSLSTTCLEGAFSNTFNPLKSIEIKDDDDDDDDITRHFL